MYIFVERTMQEKEHTRKGPQPKKSPFASTLAKDAMYKIPKSDLYKVERQHFYKRDDDWDFGIETR